MFIERDDSMKKLFGEIDLTWKKLIIFAILTGVYTAIMAIIPITADTSFRDIAIYFEWWILFGIIIICNSKSPLDSALKCFVFFLISQPLIYLLQVPFSWQGWGLFSYYRYWFIWTLACLPMGFIGYYIKKKNVISMIILLPMLIFLAYLGIGYLSSIIDKFPHHLLSFIACFAFIIIIVHNLFDKKILKIISLSIVALFAIVYILLNSGINNNEYDAYRTIDNYDINFVGELRVTYFSGTAQGDVQVVSSTDDLHSVKLNGRKNGKYEFDLTDESETEYSFEYHYDEESKSVVLNKKD